jgi:hypothetical protein
MEIINVLSWGGGTQSTALMLKMLDKEIKDETGKIIIPHYIIFSDTGDESSMTYAQIYKVQKYVKDTYDVDIIIVKKNKFLKTDQEIIDMVKKGDMDGRRYRSSEYSDLYQNQVLFYRGVLDKADIVPHWIINEKGEVGKLMGRQCTVVYKITEIIKEIRKREGLLRFSAKQHQINMFIGFTIDEISRVKPSPQSYIVNKFPLVDLRLSKQECIDYVIRKLGFKPVSSVCNMCYANDFKRVYNIFKNDPDSWNKLLVLDDAMANKPKGHRVRGDVYMFHWQIKLQKRLKDIDMEAQNTERNKYHQISIFEMEEEMACMGGCFL